MCIRRLVGLVPNPVTSVNVAADAGCCATKTAANMANATARTAPMAVERSLITCPWWVRTRGCGAPAAERGQTHPYGRGRGLEDDRGVPAGTAGGCPTPVPSMSRDG